MKNRFGHSILSNLTHYELTALALTSEMEWINNESLRPMVDLHKFYISQLLKGLCKKGLLAPSGVGRGTKYHLSDSVDGKKESESQMQKVASSDKKDASSQGRVVKKEVLFADFYNEGVQSRIEKSLSKS